MEKDNLDLLREFQKEYFPARKPPTIMDFVAWLNRNYEVKKRIKANRFDRKL